MLRPPKTLLVALLVGVAFAAVPAGAAVTQSEATLTVEVVDQDGDPIGDVEITASWDGGSNSATTASNGRAFVDVEEGADVDLNVSHPDYVRNHPYTVSDASEEEVTVDMARKGQSTVLVRDANGQPLEDATVEFEKDLRVGVRGQTDDEGRFETGTIEQGEYTVTAVKPGYFEVETDATVGSDSQQELQLERGTVQLEVSIVDDHFEEPRTLDEGRVRISDDEGEVAVVRASGGTASLSVDVNNRYTVTTLKDGYLQNDRTVTVRESARSVEVATQRVPTLTLEPANERIVVGESTTVTVTNAYGEPVSGADIVRNNETVGQTGSDGEYVVTIESTGQQELRAAQGDLESAAVTVEGVEPAETETTDEAETATGTPTGTESEGAGFGVLAALAALAGVALLARRR